jgi:alpha-1,3-rhamnosyl/mannosyltransferase
MEQKKQVLDKYNIKKKFLLTVGTLQPRKNLDRVLLAYQSLPKDILSEYQLVIVGKRGWECSELIKKILFLEKQGLIKWLEFIPFNDLRALYQSSTSLVFPSLSEGFGLPIIEGFASKTPVITSNIPSILEVAGNAAYFVNPTSVEEIQYAISSLINNTGLVKNLIEKGSDRAKLFTMEEMGNKTMLVYKQFI